MRHVSLAALGLVGACTAREIPAADADDFEEEHQTELGNESPASAFNDTGATLPFPALPFAARAAQERAPDVAPDSTQAVTQGSEPDVPGTESYSDAGVGYAPDGGSSEFPQLHVARCDFDLDEAFSAAGGGHLDGLDITEPHADVIASRAFVDGDLAVIQLQFAVTPFYFPATHFVSVLFDADGDSSSGQTGGDGAGNVWAFESYAGAAADGVWAKDGLAVAGWLDVDRNVLEIEVPLAGISNDETFRYAVVSAFGGSGGANDALPNQSPSFLLAAGAGAKTERCTPQ